MLSLFLTASLCVAPSGVPALAGSAPTPRCLQEDPGDEALRSAWERLEPTRRRELAEWFRFEARGLGTFQGLLIEHVIAARGEDAGLAPDARAPRVFDPEEHAPKLPIARRWLEPDDRRARNERERLLGPEEPDALHRAWAYDWGLGSIVRVPDGDVADVVFANALLGLGPDADLASACLLEALDGGEEREVLEAFGHTYTDREGRAFPGITLYDAWGSGKPIEMPDVDNLGIVHTVLGERRKWVSPVPERKQDSLYEAVGELYTRARRYRGLREALAHVYLRAEPPVPAGYETNRLRLHALWEEVSSTPAALRDELPDAQGWQDYLERLLRRVDADADLTARARNRAARLAADQRAVRATLVRVLRQAGVLEDG